MQGTLKTPHTQVSYEFTYCARLPGLCGRVLTFHHFFCFTHEVF